MKEEIEKENVKLESKTLYLRCKNLIITSDGTAAGTDIMMDGIAPPFNVRNLIVEIDATKSPVVSMYINATPRDKNSTPKKHSYFLKTDIRSETREPSGKGGGGNKIHA